MAITLHGVLVLCICGKITYKFPTQHALSCYYSYRAVNWNFVTHPLPITETNKVANVHGYGLLKEAEARGS